MENQHRKITGYRELTQVEIDLMNEVKQMGKDLEELHNKLKDYTISIVDSEPCVESSEAFRWLAMGRTDMQKGLMCWTRSIAKPQFF